MPSSINPSVAVICGPTATGKSEVAQQLAELHNGVVLSADSMQIYKGMDIGTAKVPPSERRVPHFGIDIAQPNEVYSASLFQEYARHVIDDQQKQGKSVFIAGGTGLYIQAIIDNLQFPKGEEENSLVRRKYELLHAEQGAQAVWDELFALDPLSAQHIHPNNTKRVIRALEMLEEGESYADRATTLPSISQVIPAVFIGLTAERSVLYDRINKRVDAMVENGLVEEVKLLSEQGFGVSLTSKQAIGYKEILDALSHHCSFEEAIASIKQSSRRYAKRQLTWFRRDTRIQWIDVTEMKLDEAAKIANTLLMQEISSKELL